MEKMGSHFASLNEVIRVPVIKIICGVFVLLFIPTIGIHNVANAAGMTTISGYITQDGHGLAGPGPGPYSSWSYCTGASCTSGGSNWNIDSQLASSSYIFPAGNVYLNNCTIGGASGSFSARVEARTGYFELTAPAGCTGELGFSVTPYGNPRGSWPSTTIDYAASAVNYTVPSSNLTLNIALPTIETVTVTAVDTNGGAITNAAVNIDRQNTSWPAFSLSLPGGGSLTGTQAPTAGWFGTSCTTGTTGCTYIVPANSTTKFTASSDLGFGVTATKTKSVAVVTSDVSTSFIFEPFTASPTTISGYITQDGHGLAGPGPGPYSSWSYCTGASCTSGGSNWNIDSQLASSSYIFPAGNVYLNNCTIGGASGSFSARVEARTGYFELTAPAGCTGELGFSVTPYGNPRGSWPSTTIDYAASAVNYTVPSSNLTLNIALPTIETVTVTAVDTNGGAITNAAVNIDRQNTSWPAFSLSLPGGGSLTGTQAPTAGWFGTSCTTGTTGCTYIVPANSTTKFTASSDLGFGLTITDSRNCVVTDSSTALTFTFKNLAEVTSKGSNSGNVKIVAPFGSEVKNESSANVSSGTLPAGAIDLVGALNFRVESITAGSSIDVQFLIPAGMTANKVVKPKIGGGFIDLTSYAIFNSDSNTVTIRYTDGGIGDADGTANGVIVDPVMFWNFAGTVPSSLSGGSGGDTPSGGGGAPKRTALYFQVVDPTDAKKIYTKSVCVEIYSRILIPKIMGTGCSGADGHINVLVGDAEVLIRVFELGNGAIYKEYIGEVANDVFTLESGVFFPGTTRYAITLPGAKNEAVTPAPVPTPTPAPKPTPTPTPTSTPTPTATPTPSAGKSTYFATTTSTKNLLKVTIKKVVTVVSCKVGKSLQVNITTVGSKSAFVKVSVKDPSSAIYNIATTTVAKNKAYISPTVKFSKPGAYVITVAVGTTKNVVTVKISK